MPFLEAQCILQLPQIDFERNIIFQIFLNCGVQKRKGDGDSFNEQLKKVKVTHIWGYCTTWLFLGMVNVQHGLFDQNRMVFLLMKALQASNAGYTVYSCHMHNYFQNVHFLPVQ